MKTLSLTRPGELSWREEPRPVPAPGEALVRVRRCGVCGTDLHALAGRQPFFSYPRRLGHELCVEVVEAPAESGLRPGDLCAVEAYAYCRKCAACEAGKTNCCRHLSVLGVHVDGGHAPWLAVAAERLHPVSGRDPELVALVEPLVIGAHGVERAALRAGEPVLIAGLGPIGLAAAIFAKAAGARVALVDAREDRTRFAAEAMRLGAPLEAGPGLERALEAHFGRLPATVIDATGNPDSMRTAFRLAEHGGRIVFLGLFPGELAFDDPDFHRRELTVLASRAGLGRNFREVARALEAGTVEPAALITHRFAFAEAAERLPALHREPGLVKAMIDFDEAE